MSKVTIKGFIYKSPYRDELSVFHGKFMEEHGYLFVGECEFEFEIPESFNPVAQEVAQLEKQLDAITDDYHAQVKQIKGRINDLKCIEYSPAGAA